MDILDLSYLDSITTKSGILGGMSDFLPPVLSEVLPDISHIPRRKGKKDIFVSTGDPHGPYYSAAGVFFEEDAVHTFSVSLSRFSD